MLGTFGFKTNDLMTLGGTGALSYLAASPNNVDENNKQTFRLSLPFGSTKGSLLLDPRFFGTLLVGWYANKGGVSASTKQAMNQAAMAGAMSLVSTEAIRYRMQRDSPDSVAQGMKLLPSFGQKQERVSGVYGAGAQHRQPAWAHQ